MLNPENVFPSILIIPSVNVDCSGVLITKGINNGQDEDLTVAFSRGVGGAVDGQAAESYLVKKDRSRILLSPAREIYATNLPVSGGTKKTLMTFEKPILSSDNIAQISSFSETIKQTIGTETKSDYKGSYDMEIGFKDDKLWLFQIRPFVENKKALSSDYLISITPKLDLTLNITLSTLLNEK